MIDALKLIVDALFWMFMGAVAFVVMGMILMGVLSPVLGLMGLALCFVAMVMAAQAVRFSRDASSMLALGYLRQAIGQNLAIGPVLASIERSGLCWRRDLKSARRAIEQGEGVAAGVAELRSVPRWAQRSIAAGEATGRLGETVARVIERMRNRLTDRNGDQLSLGGAYATLVLVLVVMAVSAVTFFVIPQYVEIANDFGVELPWQTRVTFDLAWRIQGPLLVVSWSLVLMASGFSLWTMVRGIPPVPGLWWVRDQLAWWTPPWRGAARGKSYAETAWLIGDGLRAGMSLHAAISSAGLGGVNICLKRRLNRWASQIESGQPVGESARRCRLRPELAAMVETAASSTEPGSPLDFIARLYELKAEGHDVLLRASVLPAITIVMAMLVGWITYALIVPLPMLMEASAPEWFVL